MDALRRVGGGGLIGERFISSARTENPTLPALRSQVAVGAAIGSAGVVGLGVRLVHNADTVGALWQGEAGRVLVRKPRACWPRSHADTTAPGWGAVLTGVHLAAAAIWIGALVHTTRQEPYADGTAPLAVRTSRGDGPVRLALGYPAAAINVLLTLDEHGRIIREETLADTKHLLTRRGSGSAGSSPTSAAPQEQRA